MNQPTLAQIIDSFQQEVKKLDKEKQAKCLGVLSNSLTKYQGDLEQATRQENMVAQCKILNIDFNIYLDCLSNAILKLTRN